MEKKELTDIVMNSIIGAKAVCSGQYDIIQKVIDKAKEKSAEEPKKYDALPEDFCAGIDKRKPREYLAEIKNFYNSHGQDRDSYLKDFKEYLVELITFDAEGILPKAEIEEAKKKRIYSLIAAAGSAGVACLMPVPGAIVAGIFLLRGAASGIKLAGYAKMEKRIKSVFSDDEATAKNIKDIGLKEIEEVLMENKEKIMEMIK